jgi:hypothetical protein
MQNYSKWIVALTLAAPLAATPAYANPDNNENHPHETVQMSDLPAPVQKTVQREAKGKTIESLKKETENGKTVYEVALVANGKTQQVEISDTGKVLDRHDTREDKSDTAHGSGSPR